jgi:putative protein kinase ArgK-like GTPase of G3E family
MSCGITGQKSNVYTRSLKNQIRSALGGDVTAIARLVTLAETAGETALEVQKTTRSQLTNAVRAQGRSHISVYSV